MLPTCDWVVYASGVVATGASSLALQVSDVVGGIYPTVAAVTWPPTQAGGLLYVPINGHMATFFDTDSRYMRVAWTIGGAAPGIVIGSFLGKAGNNAALGVDVGDIYVAASCLKVWTFSTEIWGIVVVSYALYRQRCDYE